MSQFVYKVLKKPKCIQLDDSHYKFIFKVKVLKSKDIITLTCYADESNLNKLNTLLNIEKGDLIPYL